MEFLIKIVIFILSTLLVLGSPSKAIPENSKVRIHLPVKHHTHYHTKTLIKTVHVPVKHHPVVEHASHKHYTIDENNGDDHHHLINWAKFYAKKKKHHSID